MNQFLTRPNLHCDIALIKRFCGTKNAILSISLMLVRFLLLLGTFFMQRMGS